MPEESQMSKVSLILGISFPHEEIANSKVAQSKMPGSLAKSG